jgi:hypothetical protein
MKNQNLYYLVFLVAFFACNSSEKKQRNAHSSPSVNMKAGKQDTVQIPGVDDRSISEGAANDLVTTLRGTPGYYHDKTTTWFSSDVIFKLRDMLGANHKLDGIRVYIGIKNSRHTFLIVPTYFNGTFNRSRPAGQQPIEIKIHKDDFSAILPGYNYAVQTGVDEPIINPGARLDDGKACPLNSAIAYGIDQQHVIKCEDAKRWVKYQTAINGNPYDKINTFSEWFETAFITQLIEDLKTPTSNGETKDGVRIYLARQTKSKNYPNRRHVFLWVSTYHEKANKDNHIDDYGIPYDKMRWVMDNGQQCLNNCHGATLQ